VLRRRLALGGSAVLLAALIVSVGTVVKWATHESVPRSLAKPPAPPAVVIPPPPPTPTPAPPIPFATDAKGFLNSPARCDGAQTAVAIGRTSGSRVVICGDESGRYGYRGVRLSDEAVLTTTARNTEPHRFVARHASVTYSVSETELRVTAGGALVKEEPMLDYRWP
jgi:hypothetical protein